MQKSFGVCRLAHFCDNRWFPSLRTTTYSILYRITLSHEINDKQINICRMHPLQIITTCVCGVATWLFIVPSRLCPNKRYRRLFWLFYPIIFFAASLSANALNMHIKWYVPGLIVIICAIVASQISIHIAPNK